MKSILFSVGLALCCVHVIAEDVTIWNDKSISGKKQQEIPIYVDINDSLLGLHFLDKVDQVTITVVGVEEMVYQKEVTTPFSESIYLDLNQYRSGEYKDTKEICVEKIIKSYQYYLNLIVFL